MDDFESFAPDDQPSLVRPYTLTAGRTDSRVSLPLEAPIEAVVPDKPGRWPGNDVRAQICAMCGSSAAVAAIAARRSLPGGVARVLIGDLGAAGHLRVRATLSDQSSIDERRELIGRTLRGLRAL